MRKVIFVGIDVDDKSFHGCAIEGQTGEIIEFSCEAKLPNLLKKLSAFIETDAELKVCYEATYLGFSLARSLNENGIACEIIASSLIPEVAGKRVKTDRLDSRKLAEYYMKGLLTPIYQPSIEDEATRDMLRSRNFLVQQTKALKLHIVSMCRRYRLDYQDKNELGQKSYWTARHREWLKSKIKILDQEASRTNLEKLLFSLDQFEQQIQSYDDELNAIADKPKYKQSVKALGCFRGIATLTALGIILELGDIKRFDHPRRLTSYAGLEISEYSSGGRENKFGISKLGNRHLRTAVIGVSQSAIRTPWLSKELKKRRIGAEPYMVEIADRCMVRLNKKGMRLLMRGKPNNKVKVACARELLGFIWETLNKAS